MFSIPFNQPSMQQWPGWVAFLHLVIHLAFHLVFNLILHPALHILHTPPHSLRIESVNFSLNILSKFQISIVSPTDSFQQTQFQHCPASLCLLMTPQYPQFELYLQDPQCQHSHSFRLPMLQNDEAFEDGMNEKIVETEDAVKHGTEKPAV